MLMVPTREKFLLAVSQITLMLTLVILSRGKKKKSAYLCGLELFALALTMALFEDSG